MNVAFAVQEKKLAVADAPRVEPTKSRKRVVIIGAGFAGLATAHALRNADTEVVLIDRRNHHIFQPLLYQVAMAVLSPAEIAAPIRQMEVKQRNLSVLLAESPVSTLLPARLRRPHRARGSERLRSTIW